MVDTHAPTNPLEHARPQHLWDVRIVSTAPSTKNSLGEPISIPQLATRVSHMSVPCARAHMSVRPSLTHSHVDEHTTSALWQRRAQPLVHQGGAPEGAPAPPATQVKLIDIDTTKNKEETKRKTNSDSHKKSGIWLKKSAKNDEGCKKSDVQ